MTFNAHLELAGKHAMLSPSNYHWLNYTEDKLYQVYLNGFAKIRGERLHALAKECIELKVKLPRTQATLNMYVNDAIGFRMTPEQPLYYSPNCFGTADAISFKNGLLRIHDLKTGSTPASMLQLQVYMAIFCLEYNVKPEEIQAELRIYQNNAVESQSPDPADIREIMELIIQFSKAIDIWKEES